MKRFKLIVPYLSGLLVLAVLCVPAYRHYYPVVAYQGWDYSTYLSDIKRVSALAMDSKNNLYISQEFKDGQGVILRRDSEGQYNVMAAGLSKPDGFALFHDGLVFGQEQGKKPVVWFSGEGRKVLFEASNVEGLLNNQQYLYAVEDLKGDGRLIRFDFESNEIRVLRENLDEAEAVAICPDGTLFYSEKEKSHIKKFRESSQDEVVVSGLNQPGMLACDERGLWIAEDATHMARVLLLDSVGKLSVVLSNLRSVQTILRVSAGEYLIAEQGRNRVIRLYRAEGQA